MLQGVLFDMDGLMFDTERIGRDGWHKAAEILHIDLPEGIIAAMRGTGTDRCREIFNAAIPGSLYDTAHDLRLRYADEVIAANGVPVKPGLRELLRRLKASDIPAVLATSTRREKALAYLQQTDVERYFTAAVFGGIGSIPGAVVGAFLIGLSETVIKSSNWSVFSDAFTFALLIIILVVKPTGLFGEKSTDKV